MILVGLVGGLALLVLAGDALVKGAVGLSARLGIPALIVSLTIVAMGTSAPELVISVQAALEGAPAIALGNVVGSNIANVLLVLGLPALVAGLGRAEGDTRQSFTMMIGATLLTGVLASTGQIGRLGGLLLLACLAAMLWHSVHVARRARHAAEPEVGGSDMSRPVIALYLVGGIIGLPIGAHYFIESAVEIARRFDVSDSVIGLTLVAFGTSLPELATSVMAAVRRNADVAVGNVIGSNLVNLLGILGVTTVVSPLGVDPGLMRLDFWVMLGSSLMLAPFVFAETRLNRAVGAVLSACYVGYLWVLLA